MHSGGDEFENETAELERRSVQPPVVSVLIVNLNKGELTLRCIASIREHTTSVPFEIIVVDNGSRVDEVEILRRVCVASDDTRLIALGQNLFFGEANNIAAEEARGEYIVFVNNDVIVTRGYLEPQLGALRTEFRAGAVGPRFLYPDGRLQEAGAYIRPDGWTIQHGNSEKANALIAGPGLHLVDYCSAACLLMRRDVFLSVAGFDPLFDPAYFEDVDLSLRLRSIGLFTYFCGDVAVIHEGNVTSTMVWRNDEMSSVLRENHRKFLARWGTYLRSRLEAEVTPPRVGPMLCKSESDTSNGLPIIYFRAAGLVRDNPMWRSILKLAAKVNKSFHTVFLLDEVCSRCRIQFLCSHIGIGMPHFSVKRYSEARFEDKDTIVTVVVGSNGKLTGKAVGPLSTSFSEIATDDELKLL